MVSQNFISYQLPWKSSMCPHIQSDLTFTFLMSFLAVLEHVYILQQNKGILTIKCRTLLLYYNNPNIINTILMYNLYTFDLKDEVRPLAYVPFRNIPLNRLSEFTPSAWSELYHRNISILHIISKMFHLTISETGTTRNLTALVNWLIRSVIK